MASFDADEQEAHEGFPGGFDSENINVNGEIAPGGFITAGFASFEMKIGKRN